MHLTLVNLLGVAIVAFCVPFVLGLCPRNRISAVALELIAGLVIGPAPALLYRPFLTWRECVAAGLLQSTNLSFIVVAVAVGTELGRIREINASALLGGATEKAQEGAAAA